MRKFQVPPILEEEPANDQVIEALSSVGASIRGHIAEGLRPKEFEVHTSGSILYLTNLAVERTQLVIEPMGDRTGAIRDQGPIKTLDEVRRLKVDTFDLIGQTFQRQIVTDYSGRGKFELPRQAIETDGDPNAGTMLEFLPECRSELLLEAMQATDASMVDPMAHHGTILGRLGLGLDHLIHRRPA